MFYDSMTYYTGQYQMIVLLAKVGFPPDLESTRSNVGGESGKGKTTHLGICNIRSFWLQVLGFPHARPRMYRFEVGVAQCLHPYRGSLTYSKQF